MGRGLGLSAIACVLALVAERASRVPSSPAPHSPQYLARLADLRRKTSHVDGTVHSHSFLVIGGTGFTGGALVDELLARGAKSVRVLSRRVPAKGARKAGVEYAKGSISDRASLDAALRGGVTAVFHTAADYGAPPFGRLGEGQRTTDINEGGMRNVLGACASAGSAVRRLIFTSTVETAFSGRDRLDATEEGSPYSDGYHLGAQGESEVTSLSHYSRTKIAAEKLLLAADKQQHGRAGAEPLRTCALRPAGIFGPRENWFIPKAVTPAFVLRALPFYFDAAQTQDWTFIYNLVWAHLAALHRMEGGQGGDAAAGADAVGGKAFFITDGEPINAAAWEFFSPVIRAVGGVALPLLRVPPSLLRGCAEALEALGARWGFAPPLTLMEAVKATSSTTHSTARARAAFGFQPLVSSTEGLGWTAEEFARRFGVADYDATTQGPRAAPWWARWANTQVHPVMDVLVTYVLLALFVGAAFVL